MTPSELPANARLHAVRITARLLQRKGSLTQLLAGEIPRTFAKEDQGFIKALCYTTFRHIYPLRVMLHALLRKPLKASDTDLEAILLIGLAQLNYMPNIPHHAVISTAVALCRTLRKEWATGLVNAVLRNAQRQHDALRAACEQNSEGRTGFPDWLTGTLRQDWPEQMDDIIRGARLLPPMTLRLNLQRTTITAYLTELGTRGIAAQALAGFPAAIQLTTPVHTDDLPGFSDGTVSVQDAGAQLAAPLLDAFPGARVLDACAAPGGKTGHLLEQFPTLELVALDHDSRRLNRVAENLTRLGQQAQLIHARAEQADDWWDGTPFDRILLDAPCSGTGVIRRHPDILWLRTPAEIETLCEQQHQLLTALWPLLKPGGILLYSTCSLLARENRLSVENWIRSTNSAQPCKIELPVGMSHGYGWQILPDHLARTDGFFYSKLCKTE